MNAPSRKSLLAGLIIPQAIVLNFYQLVPLEWKIYFSSPYNNLTAALINIVLVLFIAGKDLKDSISRTYRLFNFPVHLPNIYFFIFAFLASGFAYWALFYSIPSEIANAVILFPVMEELVSRTIFVAYPRMGQKEYLFWLLITSAIFSLAHFPQAKIISLFLFANHFSFGILQSILAFQTKRLELPIINHMLFNATHTILIGQGFVDSNAWVYPNIIALLLIAGTAQQKSTNA